MRRGGGDSLRVGRRLCAFAFVPATVVTISRIAMTFAATDESHRPELLQLLILDLNEFDAVAAALVPDEGDVVLGFAPNERQAVIGEHFEVERDSDVVLIGKATPRCRATLLARPENVD